MKQSKRKENNKRNGNDTHTNWFIQMQSETVVIIMWCQRGIALFMLCACLWRKYVHFNNLITFQRTKPAIKFRILPEMHCKWMRLQWSESSLACQPTSATQRNNRSTKWNYEQAQKRLNFFFKENKKTATKSTAEVFAVKHLINLHRNGKSNRQTPYISNIPCAFKRNLSRLWCVWLCIECAHK